MSRWELIKWAAGLVNDFYYDHGAILHFPTATRTKFIQEVMSYLGIGGLVSLKKSISLSLQNRLGRTFFSLVEVLMSQK